jgi:hypothetical protein
MVEEATSISSVALSVAGGAGAAGGVAPAPRTPAMICCT